MKKLFCLMALCSALNVAHAQWQTVVNGVTPPALIGGREADGSVLYIARARHENGVHIGKARLNSREAFISYGGKELALSNYEVFIGTGQWVKATANNFPANAIDGGYEADGSKLYIARAMIDGSYHPGKVRKNGDACIPYGGVERFVQEYEVLTTNQVVGSKLRIWVRSGDDDLRESFTITAHLKNGTNVACRGEIAGVGGGDSRQAEFLFLNGPRARTIDKNDLQGITIRFDGAGDDFGETGDNWDLAQIKIDFVGNDGTIHRLYQNVSGSIFRFTEHERNRFRIDF
jgi:Protein of unknown function (DUF3421)